MQKKIESFISDLKSFAPERFSFFSSLLSGIPIKLNATKEPPSYNNFIQFYKAFYMQFKKAFPERKSDMEFIHKLINNIFVDDWAEAQYKNSSITLSDSHGIYYSTPSESFYKALIEGRILYYNSETKQIESFSYAEFINRFKTSDNQIFEQNKHLLNQK